MNQAGKSGTGHGPAAKPIVTATRPDDWGEGLRLGIKKLNKATVGRAAGPDDVLLHCFRHNLRKDNKGHRHRSPIDTTRTYLNEIPLGPTCPTIANELTQSILDELGIKPRRKDAIMGIEMVFQPPRGADTPAFYMHCICWAEQRYKHLVLAVIHRDQKRPHMHVIALAVLDGRLNGNLLSAGANGFKAQRMQFFRYMRDNLGLRTDRPVRTATDIMISAGKGARTHEAANLREKALLHTTPVGIGVAPAERVKVVVA